jgi:hypothetical protein
MRFYGGSLQFKDVLTMPYKQFMMLYEYMIWQLRAETEEGQKINKRIERTDIAQAFGSMVNKQRDSDSLQQSFDQFRKMGKTKK